ncbi:DNA-directed DNA polymerase [Ascosphaera acerosa]|nr:DNA-directed DNA polymerase [Ascosphaera acerosa]
MAGNPNLVPMVSRKRRREPANVDVRLVEIYEDLANNDDKVRLKAAHELVSRFTPEKKPQAEEVQKVLTRLFRGLCSGRKSARVGFSVALTEVLSQVFAEGREDAASGVSVTSAIEIWEKQSTLIGDAAGQEEREYAFGRLFGAEALIKSGVIFTDSVPLEQWTKLCALVLTLSKKKPWLREECGWVMYSALHDMAVKQRDLKYAQTVLDLYVENDLAKTPEGVAIWLLAKDELPLLTFPANVWQHGSPLDRKERVTLAKIMKETSITNEEQEAGKTERQIDTGSWNPKLHFAWRTVLAHLYKQPPRTEDGAKKKSGQLAFADFWLEAVDNGLFAAASSDERKYWGFQLVITILSDAPTAYASEILTKNLLRCMMNQLAVEDRFLHKIAAKAAKALQKRASQDDKFVGPVVTGLMGPNGAVNFDQITKTKTVEKIVSSASVEAVSKTLPLFKTVVVKPGTDDVKAANSIRQGMAGLLQSVVRSQVAAAAGSKSWSDALYTLLGQALQLLARFAYFRGSRDSQSEPELTSQTQENFRGKLVSCLNVVISGRQNPAHVPYEVVKLVHDKHVSGEWGNFLIEMDSTITESVESAFKTLKKLVHKEKSVEPSTTTASSIQALKLLYSMTLLQVYNGDGDAVSMLDDLKLCYTKFLSSKKADREDAEEASDVMVEILLSFATKGSQAFRKTSEQVFEAFAEQVTASGLQSMISILEAKDNLAGQQDIFEAQEEAEEGGDDVDTADIDMEDDDSDVEQVSASEDSDDEEADEVDENHGAEDEQELEEFNAKLAEALGIDRGAEDGLSDDDQSDMNDEEMEAIDEQIAQVFRAQSKTQSKKKENKQAKETMINFKNRVLDLLQIYVKKCPTNPIALDLIIPLLRLSRRATVPQIATRASNVLREYTKLCKGSTVPEIEAASKDDALNLLRNVHQEAIHSGPASHAAACSQASLLLVKVLVAQDRSNISDIVDIYGETRKKQLMGKKYHVQPSFFADWNNWCITASKQAKA